jgi:hypothetical protein
MENSKKCYLIYASCNPYNAKMHYHNEQVLQRDGATPVKWVHSDNFGHLYTEAEALREIEKYAKETAMQHDDIFWADEDYVRNEEEVIRNDLRTMSILLAIADLHTIR